MDVDDKRNLLVPAECGLGKIEPQLLSSGFSIDDIEHLVKLRHRCVRAGRQRARDIPAAQFPGYL
jgi:hypothetical protein